ncbi:MAG: potassium transporter TrkH [Confluentimicrobium sp.]|uniref:TrkH family potassium uptake protein n=1 Tax=Actibacterium sp. TaxID=1872125 RepID=UPI000C40649B|nr:TrkH family potassium uptake protein [Actibacterium sp.]MBC58270.1 potassium transporter TrkH [Actibacterium sp.]
MLDLRPVGYVLGLLLVALGGLMLAPMALDLARHDTNWHAFLETAIQTMLTGAVLALSCQSGLTRSLSLRQGFLLTAAIWVVAPVFGALPFMEGAPHANFTDAYFEAVSGITTTGSSVFTGLDSLPMGVLLWRGLLNWLGGLGIAFVAMIFLPVMRVGGMQFFRAEGFDTLGKVLPRAPDIARMLLALYVGLTFLAVLSYLAAGMTPLDAVVNAFATISTGGFSTSDASFGKYSGPAEYVGALFMILASLPYIRFVQLAAGNARPLLSDPQVHAYLRWLAVAVGMVAAYRLVTGEEATEPVLRQSLFNIVSIFSGTGFGSADVAGWGPFPVVVAFLVGMIGGCTSSSSASISVFRWQLTFLELRAQIVRLHAPSRMQAVKYDGRPVDRDVLDALVLYVGGYILTLGVLIIAMDMIGVDAESATFAVWTSIGNIGFGFGPLVVRTGTMTDFPDAGKWIMVLAMLMGRLGLLTIFVLLMPRFWRW